MEQVANSKEIDQGLEDIRRSVQEENLLPGGSPEDAEYRRSIAQKIAAFEPKLRVFLGLFKNTCGLNEFWRRAVFQGIDVVQRDEKLDMDFVVRGLFGLWLHLSDVLRQRTEYFQRHGCRFEGNPVLDIRLYAQEARKILGSWQRPVRSLSVALRCATIPQETAEKVRQLLAE